MSVSVSSIGKWSSKHPTFLGADFRVCLIFFCLFMLHISTWTFYLFLSSWFFGLVLVFFKYDVLDFFIKVKEMYLMYIMDRKVKRIVF